MKKFKFLMQAAALVLLLVLTTNATHAQATRTWVSGVGDDANPCSRTAPCKTFAGAISKTAACGEINVLDPGGFGAVTITKCITIDGGGNIAGVLVSGVNGIIVSAGCNDVIRLRNLDIDGLGTGLAGIKFLAGKALFVENVQIYNFTNPAIDFEPNQACNSILEVDNVHLENNSGGGILVKPAGGGSARATLNQVFAALNNFGVRAEDNSKVTVRNSIASSNSSNGFIALSTSAAVEMNIEESLAMDQSNPGGAGVRSSGAQATVRLFNVSTFDNTNGWLTFGGGQLVGTLPGTSDDVGNTSTSAASISANLK